MSKFKSVSSQVDFPALEHELVKSWYEGGIVEKYLHRNDNSLNKFAYLDGPITANNPMGVHHAWGRTLKDVWQRFHNMKGYAGRFQNGFDEQGLWVEVEVEKELGLKSKKDILNLVSGDEFASLEKFVNLCKERVKKYSVIQTEQSKRLGYFMDWDNSYHTSSDTNNYAIWNFMKVVNEKGWLYKGHDSVPWCPRCGTAISQHEIESDGYQEVIHESIYFELPIEGRDREYLLVWTTTPWTLPGNIAVAVDEKLDYSLVEGSSGDKFWVLKDLVEKIFISDYKAIKIVKGKELVGLKYKWAFDDLPRVKEVSEKSQNNFHIVIATDELLMPINLSEGTGLVHTAVSAGVEDFKLGQKLGLPMIDIIDEGANYLEDLGDFSGQNAKKDPRVILDFLENEDKKGENWVFKIEKYKHRYPTCWRCKTELVWRVVDEWYIAMDKRSLPSKDGKTDESGKTYREQMIEVAKKINWIPGWALDRELDWLKNMHDWLISKKRFWGLALPIWECEKCGNFEVIGGKDELKDKSVEGWKKFEGNSPHRPWIDQVKIKCSKCQNVSSRIPDVGNPWLDAGIVPFSTLPEDWFPADLVSESFPGQFKNWFYAMIAMSTALKKTNPFKNLYGYALVKDEKGEEMHKSKGNSIEFNEAADKIGADVMRWMFVTQNPESNLLFGFNTTAEVKRRFYLILWNSYKFFIDYASLFTFEPKGLPKELSVLDHWIISRLNQLIDLVDTKLGQFDPYSASRNIEDFAVSDFSTWYIRRSRDRVGSEADEKDREVCLSVMYEVLVTLTKLAAPLIPFITEEMFRNLTGEDSVHLQDYPAVNKSLLDEKLVSDMVIVRKLAELGHAQRKEAGIKLRQPLSSLTYFSEDDLPDKLSKILANELNVKNVVHKKSSGTDPKVKLDTKITPMLEEEGRVRDLIRHIQQLRKDQNYTLADKTTVTAPDWPKNYEEQILKSTASITIVKGSELKISKVKC
ncbi:isoleucine--tRNA ligase [Candidatus Daviesbacteria bacterium RIFCSPHIGHO2_12_FULL_37_11]|uniref:Isoleucine--tRNA ligase n=1 Tax=Candidatus Daviesbacteria bacterium RIFCSPHIGHO2_12_FULL_37_11 TaxID=1797777 RepID=A0A1F5KEH9_9BACT|nr:MAG: isoleucine--tRNA ligase [Candidatus Daviesbacteria bacterium RIFCSPHIGHO2_01_FULL_37_27]OGE39264.1 MAG: isoleucine--tRNA ligase [Candidatus Daviesbacteria bacterium RIFCSPHIGHO2_12_FULL_37_11]OGE45618.1 MAG: isoleucine--tRNA ligase [Candidatus Daviesbacteria bacterium RIFCSPLOWO2_01_FULL_37_10]